jgi:hypothetical protein
MKTDFEKLVAENEKLKLVIKQQKETLIKHSKQLIKIEKLVKQLKK